MRMMERVADLYGELATANKKITLKFMLFFSITISVPSQGIYFKLTISPADRSHNSEP